MYGAFFEWEQHCARDPFQDSAEGLLLGQAEGLNVGCVAICRNFYNLERISIALSQYDLAFPGHKSIG